MDNEEHERELEAWIKSRPESVQKLAAEFPFGMILETPSGKLHLLGYTEDDCLILSKNDPFVDYGLAQATKVYLHAKHLRASH